MRAFCTVSAPLEVCAPPTRPLSPGSRFLALRLLGTPQPRTLYFLVESKSRVREVYAQTCLHFAKQGMLDTELFGLAILIDGEYMFVDPESKLSKYGPKSWRSSHTHGLDANGRPLLELHFRVQFYIESSFMLRDETSRHNYYLQLKSNAINRDVPKEYSEQSMLLLGGLALQADLGDCPCDDETVETSNTNNNINHMKNGADCIENKNFKNGNSGSCNPLQAVASPSSSSTSSSSSSPPSVSSLCVTTASPQSPNVLSLPSTSTTVTTEINASSLASPSTNSSALEYFRTEDYIPGSMKSIWNTNALHSCHKENRGMTRSDAELNYIRHACALHDAIINAHVYRMKLSKNETGLGSVWFVIYAKGIKIYNENAQPITFLWPNITKLSFDKKKFEIRSGENKVTMYSTSDEKNKMLLTLCKDTHQFSMKIATRLKEAIRREEEESDCLHACYMYSRSLNLPYKNKNDQRISVISSTSSNTTSGIVSDRVHSEDELEIIINSPPAVPVAAPSTESLALAHLLDQPSVSRQTSSVGQVSLKDLEEHLAAISIRAKTRSISSESTTEQIIDRSRASDLNETDSPNSQHNIGSQCSSTCSTVVVATDTITLSSLAAHNTTTATTRRPSTSSSLELGFSHTAQNSQVSESASTCIDHEFISTNDPEGETSSGVYNLTHPPPTETSGVYTMNSSEMTGQSSEIAESDTHENSSHYDAVFDGKSECDTESMVNIDSVDGKFRRIIKDTNSEIHEFRARSDSNISTSGSFRGDGSDPTDNKHNLLSAEELTDLIVGRGTYPSCKTVSNTLDSDCDYVTLPLSLTRDSYVQGHNDTAPSEDIEDIDDMLPTDPPAPPKRIDSNLHHSLSSLVGIRMRSPPPYNARHEKTGLCGPPVSKIPDHKSISSARDPPPYPQQPTRASTLSKLQQNSKISQKLLRKNVQISTKILPEEVPARFITSRPQINILKAHTSVVGENAKPSYAAPTLTVPSPARIHRPISTIPTQIASAPPSTIGIPVVPYISNTHKSMSSIPPPPPPYAAEVKSAPRTCVLLPVIKPRQYLPPPPPTLPRQPPPPPPAQLATVYTSQLARSQIELYQQQLYSDVDYVIYPLQDPAVSQQEYLDAKQSSILAAMAQSPPPPPYLAYHTSNSHHASTWDTCKGHALYRSTPYLPLSLSTHSRYASTQNLSDTYVQLPGAYSPLYSPSVTSLCSSYEPPPPPPLRPATISAAAMAASFMARSRSDDNILNLNSTTRPPKIKKLPPPPPPPYQNRIKKPPIPTPIENPPPIPVKPLHNSTTNSSTNSIIHHHSPQHHHHHHQQQQQYHHQSRQAHQSQASASSGEQSLTNSTNGPSIDIQILREKSKHLDLPLISALCNDRSLLKQTKAFVLPKHSRTISNNNTNNNCTVYNTITATTTATATKSSKYPVSGLNELQLLSKPRKTSVSHRHPNDKLPPLPVQTAEANNYVLDPTPSSMNKHKSYNNSSAS